MRPSSVLEVIESSVLPAVIVSEPTSRDIGYNVVGYG